MLKHPWSVNPCFLGEAVDKWSSTRFCCSRLSFIDHSSAVWIMEFIHWESQPHKSFDSRKSIPRDLLLPSAVWMWFTHSSAHSFMWSLQPIANESIEIWFIDSICELVTVKRTGTSIDSEEELGSYSGESALLRGALTCHAGDLWQLHCYVEFLEPLS